MLYILFSMLCIIGLSCGLFLMSSRVGWLLFMVFFLIMWMLFDVVCGIFRIF